MTTMCLMLAAHKMKSAQHFSSIDSKRKKKKKIPKKYETKGRQEKKECLPTTNALKTPNITFRLGMCRTPLINYILGFGEGDTFL